MEEVACCNEPNYIVFDGDLICANCGEESKKKVNTYENLENKKMSLPNIRINNNKKTMFINNNIPYSQIKSQTLFNFLKQKNTKSEDRIHENILESTVKEYIEKTKNKIYRSNKRSECLALILYQQCIKFNNPKTITFIINYMDLTKGGISRGIKALSNVSNIEGEDSININYFNEDKLVILKNYLEKLLTLTPKQLIPKNNVTGNEIYLNLKKEDLTKVNKTRKKKTEDISPVKIISNITPYLEIYKKMVIKILNFINKLGVFNEFRTITKIVGTIWLVIKINKLKYNNNIFKQIKIEKNTIKQFSKKAEETIYFRYCEMIVESYKNEFNEINEINKINNE
jgi:hypothetical protein